MIDNLPPIAEVIRTHQLEAKKSLGQNFILDLNITRKIARTAKPFYDTETLLEIGPGPGALTRGLLLEGATRVLAIEKDARCLHALNDLVHASSGRLKVLEKDALTTPLQSLTGAPFKIVANLPYNISTSLLMQWFEELDAISGLVLMFQKEVANRLVATPRSKAYGRLSILTQVKCSARIAFDLPPSAFKPAPKVTSSIVILKPHTQQLPEALWKALVKITAFAFAQRRKMLRTTLIPAFPNPGLVLDSLGLKETMRAEELTVHDFINLAKLYHHHILETGTVLSHD